MRGQLNIEARQRGIITRLINENKRLRAENKELKERVRFLESKTETLELQIKELQKIIFGRKHSGDKDDDNDGGNLSRSKSSYRRSIPKPEEITKIESYSIDTCPDCGTFLIYKITLIRYIIDILLPHLNEQSGLLETPAKTVVKQTIEKGWCPTCKCWHMAKLPSHSPPVKNNEVLLGQGVKEFVDFQSNIIRDTYTQIQDELIGLYNIEISQGEIAKILDKTSDKLSPAYERLKERIKKSKGCHLDETGWQTRGEKNYVHINASTDNEEVVFLIGRNRGKGNSVELVGEDYEGVVISDFLANYKNMPGDGEHQGCWSHLLRKTRDLKNNGNLKENKRNFVLRIHTKLKGVFSDTKAIILEPFDLKSRKGKLPDLYRRIENIAQDVYNSRESFKKLTDIANLMLEYKKELFTCVTHDGIPLDNNKAEQGLRHLVLKRKNSFGTQSEKGNKTLEINLSVLLSLWRQNKATFWPQFRELMA
jgi:transposase